jgi:hypothetical protein
MDVPNVVTSSNIEETTIIDIITQQKTTIDECRNPTLAKCGGEAQHLEKLRFGVLRDSRMFRARQQGAKHLALGCSWCHWKGLET